MVGGDELVVVYVGGLVVYVEVVVYVGLVVYVIVVV